MEFLGGKIDLPDKLFKIFVKSSLLQVGDFKNFLPFLGGGVTNVGWISFPFDFCHVSLGKHG